MILEKIKSVIGFDWEKMSKEQKLLYSFLQKKWELGDKSLKFGKFLRAIETEEQAQEIAAGFFVGQEKTQQKKDSLEAFANIDLSVEDFLIGRNGSTAKVSLKKISDTSFSVNDLVILESDSDDNWSIIGNSVYKCPGSREMNAHFSSIMRKLSSVVEANFEVETAKKYRSLHESQNGDDPVVFLQHDGTGDSVFISDSFNSAQIKNFISQK
jgi:hypothetical protein